MNRYSEGPWRFRWGKKAVMKSLGRNLPGASMFPGRLFRRAPILGPVIAWIAGAAVHDLRQPDSRIKAFARRLLEKRHESQQITTITVTPTAIEDNDERIEKAGGEPKKLEKK